MNKVFVYGTLKTGQGNHWIIEGCKGMRGMAPGMSMHAGTAFPFAMRGDGVIKGELYEVDDAKLAELDRLEGHPRFYHRERTAVYDEDFKRHEAWIYLNAKAGDYPKVKSGDWHPNTTREHNSRFVFI